MSDTGYIQVRVYASFAQLPLEGAAISVTASDGTLLALRITDRSGKIIPIEIPVPDAAESQAPEEGAVPYTTVNLRAGLRGYEEINIQNLQVFSGIVTRQNLEMIPLSEFAPDRSKSETFDTTPQNL